MRCRTSRCTSSHDEVSCSANQQVTAPAGFYHFKGREQSGGREPQYEAPRTAPEEASVQRPLNVSVGLANCQFALLS